MYTEVLPHKSKNEIDNVLSNKQANWGLNALTEKYEELILAGDIDPVKVTRCALQNASSVAALLLTTDALISERPKGGSSQGGHSDHDDM